MRRPAAIPGHPLPLAILAACALVALAGQSLLIPVDADVSWLITVSERLLAGERLYLDVFEVNPPASVWLYLPQVALAQALSLRPEAVIVTLVALLALASDLVTLRLARGLERPPNPMALAAALGFVTLVLPGGLFAQREHYALLLILPLCALLARTAERRPPPIRTALAAGLAGGLLMVIKPHFAAALVLPAAHALWRSRAGRPLAAAAAASLAVVALYAWATWHFTPAYFDRLDMLRALYLPMRERWPRLLYGPVVLFPAALLAIMLWLRRSALPALGVALALAALGFTIAALVQGKGYWNHALPAVALLTVAVIVQATSPGVAADRRRLAVLGVAALGFGGLAVTARIAPPPGLVAALRQVTPAHPTMVTVGTELRTGHPAVRLVGGRWVGVRAALFTAAGVRYRTADWTLPASADLQRWYREDLDLLARDIAVRHPDVLLVERDQLGWLGRDPAIAHAMAAYRPAARAGGIDIWVRR